MVPRGAGRDRQRRLDRGKEGNPMAARLLASKAAVIGMTKSDRQGPGHHRRARQLHRPGRHRHADARQMSQEHIDYMVEKIPMGRMGAAEEVAELSRSWPATRMTFSTGATFDISGGRAVF
jgi:3-oxoacyl-[acyl-carrier protein] reductase